jgi:hypothetical protein
VQRGTRATGSDLTFRKIILALVWRTDYKRIKKVNAIIVSKRLFKVKFKVEAMAMERSDFRKYSRSKINRT